MIKDIKIPIKLKKNSYDIIVGFDNLSKIGNVLNRLKLGDSVFIITSPKIGKLYLNQLISGLKKYGYKDFCTAYIPDGENNKNASQWLKVSEKLSEFDNNKNIIIITLGGGVIGDTGGFVASTYDRGKFPHINIPTTLLAFVDCGIGGKTAINLKTTKNKIGTFHQPKLVYGDLNVLKTLNKRELKSGLSEAIKHSVISSYTLFYLIENYYKFIFSLSPELMLNFVKQNYLIKSDIVSKDEFDTKDIRAKLNYGHTIGHAVEAASNYKYKHGESISIGMVCANDIAVELKILKKENADRIENLLINVGLPTHIKNITFENILEHFQHDKKFINGKNKFILISEIGKSIIIEDIPLKIIKNIINNRIK